MPFCIILFQHYLGNDSVLSFYELEITFFQEMAELKAFVLFIYLFNQKNHKALVC